MAVLVLQFIQIRPPDKHVLFLTANLYGVGYFQKSKVFSKSYPTSEASQNLTYGFY